MMKILNALLIVGMFISSPVHAEDYPTSRVTIVVPFTPGGSNDAIARFLGNKLSELWGQTVVVENRPGAGSALGAAHVARAKPDGYTLLIGSTSYATNAAINPNLGFDPVEDLVPISMVGTNVVGIIAGSRVPMETLDDLIRESKTNTIYYATSGVGSFQHFNGLLLNDVLGINMQSVSYGGGTEGLVDLIGGRVDLYIAGLGVVQPALEAGAKNLAVLSSTRSAAMPDVPTTAEAGYPQAAAQNYWSIFVPAGTPHDISLKINDGVQQVMNSDDGRNFMKGLFGEPSKMTTEEVGAYVKNEIEYWKQLAKKNGLVVE